MCNPASLDLSAFLFDLLTDFSTAAFGKEPLITVRTYTCRLTTVQQRSPTRGRVREPGIFSTRGRVRETGIFPGWRRVRE